MTKIPGINNSFMFQCLFSLKRLADFLGRHAGYYPNALSVLSKMESLNVSCILSQKDNVDGNSCQFCQYVCVSPFAQIEIEIVDRDYGFDTS